MTQRTVTVGEFTYADDTVHGPATYMHERGLARIDRIEQGLDLLYNCGLPTINPLDTRALATFVLVSLQTDYAAWLGQRQPDQGTR